MSDDFGYINARLRGMKSRLLSAAVLERLLAAGSFEETVGILDLTPYGVEVEGALTLRPGIAGVDEGLRRNLQQTFAAVARLTSDRPRDLVHLAMGRWEIHNVKTVLRGRHANAPLDEILSATLPFGRLDEVALRELARQPDVPAMATLLSQWRIPWSRHLRDALPRYRDTGDLQSLEIGLDRAFFRSALADLDPQEPNEDQVRCLIKSQIDLANLGFALRLAQANLTESDPAAWFIPGGREPGEELFGRLLHAGGVEAAVRLMSGTAWSPCLEDGIFAYMERHRVSVLERALEGCFVRRACAAIGRDPLTVSSVIGFLWLKVNEVSNLRVITRGKYTSMPREEIERQMIVTGVVAA